MSTPGVTVGPLREMTGSVLFNEVFLDDVFIPYANVVRNMNDGWNVARTTLAGDQQLHRLVARPPRGGT